MKHARAEARLAWRVGALALCLLGALAAGALPGCGCRSCSGSGSFTPECGGDAGDCPVGYICQSGVCLCDVQPEVCDGEDNDCDMEVDEVGAGGLTDVGGPCPDVAGACAGGVLVCSNANLVCSVKPVGETCNNTDDDCDGVVDNDVLQCACAPGGPGPGPEVCNNIDDDCNEMIDDGLAPECACAPGGPGPGPEVCNGVDDDCNGLVDDGNFTGIPEVCNNVDDDCNGLVDDGLAPACACAPGGPGPGPEVCNEIDDDCNEMIDEVNSLNGMPCGQFGDPCAMNSDCSSQLCVGDVFDMYCSDECNMVGDPGDCPLPPDYRCWDNPSAGGSDYCRRNYAPCTRDADCAAGEICAITCDDTGTDAITECRPAIAGGAPAPDACATDPDCETYDCFRTDICLGVCGSDADCAMGYRCVQVQTFQCGGLDYVPRCLDACDCDSECPAGQLCQPYVHVVLPPSTATTVGACDIDYTGTAPDDGGPGDDCDLTSMPILTCDHAICSNGGTGFCTQVCSTTCGCPAGIGPCVGSTITFPDLGSYPGMTCDTP
jgi:hypothetical protein